MSSAARARTEASGAVNTASTTRPASFITLETSMPRRRFSLRSPLLKPRSRLMPARRAEPSTTAASRPRSKMRRSTARAISLLPEPESPVNSSVNGFCPSRASRCAGVTVVRDGARCPPCGAAFQWPSTSCGSSSMPAPAVALVRRSMRMNAPVWRFLAYAS